MLARTRPANRTLWRCHFVLRVATNSNLWKRNRRVAVTVSSHLLGVVTQNIREQSCFRPVSMPEVFAPGEGKRIACVPSRTPALCLRHLPRSLAAGMLTGMLRVAILVSDFAARSPYGFLTRRPHIPERSARRLARCRCFTVCRAFFGLPVPWSVAGWPLVRRTCGRRR